MQITLNLSDDLIQEVMNLSLDLPIEQVIENALQTYLRQQKQLKIIDLFGAINYDQNYNYKQQRAVQ